MVTVLYTVTHNISLTEVIAPDGARVTFLNVRTSTYQSYNMIYKLNDYVHAYCMCVLYMLCVLYVLCVQGCVCVCVCSNWVGKCPLCP